MDCEGTIQQVMNNSNRQFSAVGNALTNIKMLVISTVCAGDISEERVTLGNYIYLCSKRDVSR